MLGQGNHFGGEAYWAGLLAPMDNGGTFEIEVMAMDAAEFADRLGRLSRHEIDEIATSLRTALGSAEGEVAWWKATITVDKALRLHGQARQAGRAAWAAAHAVLESAEREGMLPEGKDDVTAVARAASDVARGLVAGGSVSVALADLVRIWRPVFVPAVA